MAEMVGRYRLLEPLAIGGTAGVWRGWDERLGRTVAVKILDRTLLADPVSRERLQQEAVILARLNHPRIAALYDFGTDGSVGPEGSFGSSGGGAPFLVLELIDGLSLADLLRGGGRLPWPAAVRVAGQVAEALAAAHEQGLVHRDIAPGNVLLSADGVKVVDFGIGAVTGAPESYFGTPGYVAPERLQGAPAQPAIDVYALGVLLHQLLFGELPGGPGRDLPAGLAGDLPAEVATLLERCLAEAPGRRPTAAGVAAVLSAATPAADGLPGTDAPGLTRMLLASPPPPRRGSTRSRTVAVAVLTAALSVWGFLIVRGGTPPAAATGGTPPAAPCHVAYQVTRDDGKAFAASLTVTNTGPDPLPGWAVAFGMPGGQRVDPSVSTQWTEDGTVVRSRRQITGLDPAKTARLDFAGAYAGSNPLPTRFTVNDQPCTATVLGVPGARPIAGAPLEASTRPPAPPDPRHDEGGKGHGKGPGKGPGKD